MRLASVSVSRLVECCGNEGRPKDERWGRCYQIGSRGGHVAPGTVCDLSLMRKCIDTRRKNRSHARSRCGSRVSKEYKEPGVMHEMRRVIQGSR